MTREQYLSDECCDYLTAEEKRAEEMANVLCGFGLTDDRRRIAIELHRTGRKHDDYNLMAHIEYLLTDINFHTDCELLRQGKYDEVLARIRDVK